MSKLSPFEPPGIRKYESTLDGYADNPKKRASFQAAYAQELKGAEAPFKIKIPVAAGAGNRSTKIAGGDTIFPPSKKPGISVKKRRAWFV